MQILLVITALMLTLLTSHAREFNEIPGAPTLTFSYESEAETRGSLTMMCGQETFERTIGAPPSLTYVERDRTSGLIIVRFLEAQRVAWSLKRALLIPVVDCAFGEPYPVVEEDAFVYATPVEEPDVSKMTRSIATSVDGDDLTIIIETVSDKVFLDPDGGKPYARFRRLWPDEVLSFAAGTNEVKKVTNDFWEPTARSRLYRSGVRAADGWFRVDTPQSRSQDAPVR